MPTQRRTIKFVSFFQKKLKNKMYQMNLLTIKFTKKIEIKTAIKILSNFVFGRRDDK